MHSKITRFGTDGILADDSMFEQTRETHEKYIIDGMREGGFIPILGLGPFFSTRYRESTSDYEFVITVYGTFVGERKSWRLEGMDMETGMVYPKSTRLSKSKQS